MRVLALLPAHNEQPSLSRLVGDLRRCQPGLDLLVVDDASEDGTSELLPTLPVRWLRLSVQLGIGGAVRAGLRYALWAGYDAVVRLDADGQHPAELAQKMIEALSAHEVDAVRGSRYKEATPYRTPLMRRAAQRLLALGLSLLTGRKVTDPTSGLWAFGPRALRLLAEHHPTGYPEPELILLLARSGLRVCEVSVQMRERASGQSTLTLPRAGAALARAVLAMMVVPLRASVKESDDD